MHHQVIIHTLSGNTIEGVIHPGDAEEAANQIGDLLADDSITAITIEQDGHCFVTVPVKNIECVIVGDATTKEA